MRNEDVDFEMGKKHHAPGREEYVHKDYNGSRNQRYTRPSRNLTWRRDPHDSDQTTRLPVRVDPPASSVVTNPLVRSSYRFGARESPQYNPQPVYPPNVYRAYGYGYGTHVYPSHDVGARYSHGSRDRYTPPYGSRDYYPPSRGSAAYPIQGAGAFNPPSYGIRGPGHMSYSHGVSARDFPSHGKAVHGFPSNETGAIVSSTDFPAVTLRGLPRNCREADIIRFFDGLDIVDVFFIYINKVFSRKAFVLFSNVVTADLALQRDKLKLGYASVEISACRRHDYYDAVAASVNDGTDFGNPLEHKGNNVLDDVNYHEDSHGQSVRFKDSNVVNRSHKRKSDAVADSKLHGQPDDRLENLVEENQGKLNRHIMKLRSPCFVDKKVIPGVFCDCNLREDMVYDVFGPDGKPTGEMLLEFISQEDANKALSKDKTIIESHLIEIIPCAEDSQITNTKQRQSESHHRVNDSEDKKLMGSGDHSHSKPRSDSDNQQKVYTQVLRLGKVPPSADKYDIIKFFGEFNLTLDRLHVVCRRNGMATGEVYVEFNSVEDAKKAISKHKKMILSNSVELFASSPSEASRAMSKTPY